MSVRRCPNCGRRQLSLSSFLSQPFRVRVQCDYCDSGFVLRKGWVHYLLIVILWFIVLLVYSEVGLWEADVFLKILASSFFAIFAVFLSSRLGKLQSYAELRGRRRQRSSATHSAEPRFHSPRQDSGDERIAI